MNYKTFEEISHNSNSQKNANESENSIFDSIYGTSAVLENEIESYLSLCV